MSQSDDTEKAWKVNKQPDAAKEPSLQVSRLMATPEIKVCEMCLGFLAALLQGVEQNLFYRQISLFSWINATFHWLEDFST